MILFIDLEESQEENQNEAEPIEEKTEGSGDTI